MFAALRSRLERRVLRGMDLSLEFATLGEYRLAPPLDCEAVAARPRAQDLPRRPTVAGLRPATVAGRSRCHVGGAEGGARRVPSCAG